VRHDPDTYNDEGTTPSRTGHERWQRTGHRHVGEHTIYSRLAYKICCQYPPGQGGAEWHLPIAKGSKTVNAVRNI